MLNRVTLLLSLDTAMLLLVCVLECVTFTGIQLHEWLGFALCPLVLLHVVIQWQWFITQFQRIRTSSGWRVRINAYLNLALLLLMAAVLLSGVLVSRLGTTVFGEGLGRVRVWSDIHGSLNFILVVLVGLHLALNWDWMIAALRRRRPERPALTGAPERTATASRRSPAFARSLGRGLAVMLIASLAAGVTYLAFAPTTPVREEPSPNTQLGEKSPPSQLVPRPRPPEWPHGLEQLAVTTSALALVVIIGRYVFRLRL